MDIGAAGILAWVASSTNQSLVTYSPIFLLIAGLILAFVVIYYVLGIVTGRMPGDLEMMDTDDTIDV